jgi:D-isomer specific 2-hydroxyacid dehydrogenase, NAD binding domain
VLEALGPDGVLINVARGLLVDEKAPIEALKNKTILAAGLDVFENEPSVPQELIALDKTVLSPHVAAASVKTFRAMAECMVSNLFAWADGKPPLDPVSETPSPGHWKERSDRDEGRQIAGGCIGAASQQMYERTVNKSCRGGSMRWLVSLNGPSR